MSRLAFFPEVLCACVAIFCHRTIWDQFSALLPERVVSHPWGCHRPRIPDRVVFDKLVQVLVFGVAYVKIADSTCSAATIRNRRDEWLAAGTHEGRPVVVDEETGTLSFGEAYQTLHPWPGTKTAVPGNRY